MKINQLPAILILLAGLASGCKKDQEKPTQPDATDEVIFTGQRSGAAYIGVMQGDGSNARALVSSFSSHRKPIGSHRGDRLLFYKYEGGTYNLYLLNRADGTSRLLTADAHHAAWSPDDSQVAFVRSPVAGTAYQLYLINSDGSGERQVTSDDWAIYPAWFPGGQQLLYGSNGGFYIINADGTSQRKIDITYPAFQVAPVLSPDGSRIAFTIGRTAGQEVFVMGIDGANLRRVAFTPGLAPVADLIDVVFPFDAIPVWSPDGTRISYGAFGADKLSHVYVVGANGDRLREVSVKGEVGHSPAWSPDGQHLYFTASKDHRSISNIMVGNVDGAKPVALLEDGQFRMWPVVLR